MKRHALTPILLALAAAAPARLKPGMRMELGPTYLPSGRAAKILTVAPPFPTRDHVVVLTRAEAVKETGPREAVARFGEVYSFTPAFFVVRAEVPVRISFINLQPDDLHDMTLSDEQNAVLMRIALPPLAETVHAYTFHRPGLYHFICTLHQPAMSGQILVLPREPGGEPR
jgi:plastocyanin